MNFLGRTWAGEWLVGLGRIALLSRDAMQYAYANDVTIIASNSDLDAFHHNYPNTSQHAISVHAIVYDAQSVNGATTSRQRSFRSL